MIVHFTYPSSPQYTGGVVTLYHFANGLARLGHEVHFIHGPANPYRITSVDQLSWFPFDHRIVHHVVDDLADASIPPGDVVMAKGAPPRLGLPVSIVQGHWMVPEEMEATTYRTPGLTVCIASWLVGIGRSYGADPCQLVFVPQGIDHDLFQPSTPLHERHVDVVLLYNKHPAKGWAVARQAAEIVRDRRPATRFEVFGILPPEHRLPDWLPFRSGADRHELADEIYGGAKIFVQPSWYEGFGLTAVEAMACGCALVTTDNGGSDDYAIAGETALTAAPGDAEGLAGHVLRLLDHDRDRVEMAQRGERFVRRFTWDRAAELLAGHLERYLADPASFTAPPGPDRPELRAKPVASRPAPG